MFCCYEYMYFGKGIAKAPRCATGAPTSLELGMHNAGYIVCTLSCINRNEIALILLSFAFSELAHMRSSRHAQLTSSEGSCGEMNSFPKRVRISDILLAPTDLRVCVCATQPLWLRSTLDQSDTSYANAPLFRVYA